MTEEIDLSRRTVLGAIGAIGVGSVAGGMGTSAYFSDSETAGVEMAAGELDLKLVWTEHYADGSDDETENVGTVGTEPGNGLTGFPSMAPEAERTVFVSDPRQFAANTAIEAFPDVDPRGPEPDEASDYDGQRFGPLDDDICDVEADLDGVLNSPYRTGGVADRSIGGAPNPQTTSSGDPLVNISDVKPGDFGGVTFGFHLCGNPGYVWLTGALRDASEGGYTEPELDDTDESASSKTDPDPANDSRVELLDEIRAALWYDTGEDGVYGADADAKDTGEGDGIYGGGETLVPLTGTLRSVLTALENNPFPLDAEPVSDGGERSEGAETGGTSSSTVSGDVSGHLAEDPIVTTEDDRFTQSGLPGAGSPRNYSCADYENLLGLSSLVGSEVLDSDDVPIVAGREYRGCTTVTVDAVDGPGTGDIALSSSGPVKVVSVKGGPDGEQVYVFGEPVVLDGAEFTTPGGAHGISNVDVCCPVGDDTSVPPEETPSRQCFPNSTTAYVGFEWWLPVDHANEVQTDSVSFDIGFYTEQCRHNDGTTPGLEGPQARSRSATTSPTG
jgi:predicted ribosomally synthesized peptide with SipW-like signal peptide